jgi:hypothetical protein
MRSKGAKTRADGRIVHEDYLVCDNMQRGVIRDTGDKCHNNVRFNYGVVEDAVLDAILSDALDDTHFAEGSLSHQLSIEHAQLSMDLDRLRRKAKSTLDLLGDDKGDEDAKEAYRQAKVGQDNLKIQIAEVYDRLLLARGHVSPEEHATRIASVRADMHSADEDTRHRARTTVRLAINELVSELSFHRKGRRVGVKLLSGSRNITISGEDGRITFDIAPSKVSAATSDLSDRQERARDRVLESNRSRRRQI